MKRSTQEIQAETPIVTTKKETITINPPRFSIRANVFLKNLFCMDIFTQSTPTGSQDQLQQKAVNSTQPPKTMGVNFALRVNRNMSINNVETEEMYDSNSDNSPQHLQNLIVFENMKVG